MRARLVDAHVRVRVDGAPGLEVEGELEPLALRERGVGYPDAQPPAAEPLDTAAGALEEGDEVAGAPRVVELDLHGPQLRRAEGLTIVMAAHDLTLAGRFAERLVLLSQGSIVADGPPQDVLVESILTPHYGAGIKVLQDADGPVVVPTRRRDG